jgi:hypothetical protein
MINVLSQHIWEIVAGLVMLFIGCLAAGPLARFGEGRRDRRQRQRHE